MDLTYLQISPETSELCLKESMCAHKAWHRLALVRAHWISSLFTIWKQFYDLPLYFSSTHTSMHNSKDFEWILQTWLHLLSSKEKKLGFSDFWNHFVCDTDGPWFPWSILWNINKRYFKLALENVIKSQRENLVFICLRRQDFCIWKHRVIKHSQALHVVGNQTEPQRMDKYYAVKWVMAHWKLCILKTHMVGLHSSRIFPYLYCCLGYRESK